MTYGRFFAMISPDGLVEAALTMVLDAGLRTGYSGYYNCSAAQ